MFTTLLQVALGGAIGASARYLVILSVAFPFGTLLVNVVGSFLMGVALVSLLEKGADRWTIMIMTGVLGGFTTFSAFSLDTFALYEANRIGAALGYVFASVILSILALFLGVMMMKAIHG